MNEYEGSLINIEYKTDNIDEFISAISTMHKAFMGLEDYINNNVIVSESYDSTHIAGTYVCRRFEGTRRGIRKARRDGK